MRNDENVDRAEQVAALTRGGVPLQIAEAVVEMLAAFSAGRIVPEGNRAVAGTTTIDEVLAGVLGAPREAEA